ncbi:hypothetical protein GCM10009654_13720 [Streptomyces hebeiensis]|uniref:Uncharacterized protein n=1 Tax=Streptomyces hebeiensis TaxID=229486 RepID=A0ABN1UMC7_9ACTN
MRHPHGTRTGPERHPHGPRTAPARAPRGFGQTPARTPAADAARTGAPLAGAPASDPPGTLAATPLAWPPVSRHVDVSRAVHINHVINSTADKLSFRIPCRLPR